MLMRCMVFDLDGCQGRLWLVYEQTGPIQELQGLLQKGDKLFLYTDGLPEAANAGAEMFGTGRMIEALNANADLGPREILSGMKSVVDVFVGDAEPFDDLTMLCLEYARKQ